MKKTVSFFVLLSSLLILQGCCSLKIPEIEARLPFVKDLACAGKGVHVPLDRFIIRLKQDIPDEDLITLMEMVFPEQRPITIERCECGDPDLMMIVLGEAMETKGDLLTSVAGLKGGRMNSDPVLLYEMKHSVYKNLPDLPPPGSNPNVGSFISDETDAMVLVVLDSGINLNRFTGEKFLFQNPEGLDCIDDSEPSSGYNFIDNDANIQDDNDSHGTLVTKKITEELKGSGVKYKILPLKIAKDRLVSYWDLLCAMSFAKQLKVDHGADIKIINASLGFKLNDNKLPLIDLLNVPDFIPLVQMSLLKEYVDYFSTSAIMITSAGNSGEDVDNSSKFVFYPAGFKAENLIAVGGLKKDNDISLHKKSNYGIISIDIAPLYEHDLMGNSIGGTSIGTAQISASFAKFLHQNTNSTLPLIGLKDKYLEEADDSPALRNYIKDGKYEKKIQQ